MPAKKRTRKKNSGNKQVDTDVRYSSKFWKRNVTATDVFINPSLDTGEGTRQLIAIASNGRSEFVPRTTELFNQSKQADHDQHFIYYSNLYILREKRKKQGATFNEKKHQRALLEKGEPFEQQKLRIDTAHDNANELVYKFEQLEKLATNLLATQDELGDQITKLDYGRKKVAISAKCIDSVWKDIITDYNCFNKLHDQILTAKATLPKITGQVMSIEINGRQDDGGNDLERQKFWVYDPNQDPVAQIGGHDRTDDYQCIDGLPRIEYLEDEEVGADSTLPYSNEASLIEDFEDKCQLTPASKCPHSLSVATSPSTFGIMNSDGGCGDQGVDTAVEKQEKKPIEAGSGRKRKARDDSPVPEDNDEGNVDEDETDDDLRFICD